MSNIYFVAGGKGGVGKSLLTIAIAYLIQELNVEPVLFESDTSNPDSYKILKDEMTSKTINLDISEGWIDLINRSQKIESPIVINSAARNNMSLSKNSSLLTTSLNDLNKKLITLWVINRQRDSIELLKEFMETTPPNENHTIHVIRNNYFGEENKFELFNNSKIKKTIEENNGLIIDLPDLADRVCDDIYTKRHSIRKSFDEQPLGNKAELRRWVNLLTQNFSEVFKHGV